MNESGESILIFSHNETAFPNKDSIQCYHFSWRLFQSLWRTIENVFFFLLFQSLNLKLGTIAIYSFGLYALFFIRTEEFFNDAMHV